MKIGLINNSPASSGTGRYAFNLYDRLKKECDIEHIYLDYPSRRMLKLGEAPPKELSKAYKIPLVDNKPLFFYRIKKNFDINYNIFHVTHQILSFINVRPKIVTCLDLIGLAYPQWSIDKIISKLFYSGIKDADKIITISDFTKKEVMNYLDIPEDKIIRIYLAADEKYKPIKHFDDERILYTYKKYDLSTEYKYVLYLGSEHPRKNVSTIIKAFYNLKKNNKIKNVKLLKVGSASWRGARRKLINTLNQLNLVSDTIFLDFVPEEDLSSIYNIADIFVYPSLYEGFGLPPLEAMACGTPVITSNTTSLPEVVGDSGIMVDPYDINGLAEAMYNVLTDDNLRNSMTKKGLERAKLFSWEKTAQETLKIYKNVYDENG